MGRSQHRTRSLGHHASIECLPSIKPRRPAHPVLIFAAETALIVLISSLQTQNATRGRTARKHGRAALTPMGEASAPDMTPGHGRHAESPGEIPAKGWKDILLRTWSEVQRDNIGLLAAGVAFYVLMAIFPAIVCLVSLYGVFAHAGDVAHEFAAVEQFLPAPARAFVGEQMTRLAAARPAQLSSAILASTALSLWSANGAAKAMFLGLNIAYEEREKRPLLKLNLIAFGFTLGLMTLAVSMTLLLVAAGSYRAPEWLVWCRWPMQWFVLIAGLALLYRFGPSRAQPRWRWVSWGSAIAAALWLVASAGLSFYLNSFAKLDAVYGPLGGAVGFLIWVYWSAYIVLVGAELNAEMEHQTIEDSTTGAPQPLGARGARMADTLGRIR